MARPSHLGVDEPIQRCVELSGGPAFFNDAVLELRVLFGELAWNRLVARARLRPVSGLAVFGDVVEVRGQYRLLFSIGRLEIIRLDKTFHYGGHAADRHVFP